MAENPQHSEDYNGTMTIGDWHTVINSIGDNLSWGSFTHDGVIRETLVGKAPDWYRNTVDTVGTDGLSDAIKKELDEIQKWQTQLLQEDYGWLRLNYMRKKINKLQNWNIALTIVVVVLVCFELSRHALL